MTIPSRPRFTGVRVYNDPGRLFSFWYPHTWHIADSGPGRVILAPTSDHIATSFSVDVQDLGTAVRASDLPLLREGLEESFKQFADSVIEHFETFEQPDRLGFDVRYTFSYGEGRGKRRILLYYVGTMQYSLIAQGATVEDFDYWVAMFAYMMLTCRAGGFDLRTWAEQNSEADEAES